MKKPSLGWQSWSSPFPKWHGFPLWDYSPFAVRKLPKKIENKNALNIKYWCSWYAYGWDITHQKIEATVKSIKKNGLSFTHIIIDDGWTTWGDWHTPTQERFPDLKKTIKTIQASGLKTGLWFAPFLASKDSKLFQDKPEWFLRSNGKPIRGLKIFPWLDWFLPHEYLLNLELKPVKKYLADFVDKAVNEWRVDLLKLDFLYAPYFNPLHKSDRLPHKQVEWIFKYIQTKHPHVITIACGAPFAPTINLASSIRISQDTALPPIIPAAINKWLYRSRIRVLKLKLQATTLFKNLNIDPDVRMFALDNHITSAFWNKSLRNIQGIGDNLTQLSKSNLALLKKWLKNN
jgi:hypothetical protein